MTAKAENHSITIRFRNDITNEEEAQLTIYLNSTNSTITRVVLDVHPPIILGKAHTKAQELALKLIGALKYTYSL